MVLLNFSLNFNISSTFFAFLNLLIKFSFFNFAKVPLFEVTKIIFPFLLIVPNIFSVKLTVPLKLTLKVSSQICSLKSLPLEE